MNPAIFDAAMQYGALGLLGLVVMVGSGIVVTITRATLKTFEAHVKATQALTAQIQAETSNILGRIDTSERALHDNVNATRYALRQEHDETRKEWRADHAETRAALGNSTRQVLAEIRRPAAS